MAEAKAGMLQQAEALAEALGLAWETRTLQRHPWLDLLPQGLWHSIGALDVHGLTPPWPDIVIASGRYAARVALAIRSHRPEVALCQIQDPRWARRRFKVIVTPRHDATPGGNVIATLGSVHGISSSRLATAANAWQDRLHPDSRPLLAILLGGPTRHCRWSSGAWDELLTQLEQLHREQAWRLAVSASRRTPKAWVDLAEQRLGPLCQVFYRGQAGANPYRGMLGLADAILVTADSVNMLTEAAATEAVVYRWGEVRPHSRLARFHAAMAAAGHLQDWGLPIAARKRPPLLELPELAAAVCQRLGLGPANAQPSPITEAST